MWNLGWNFFPFTTIQVNGSLWFIIFAALPARLSTVAVAQLLSDSFIDMIVPFFGKVLFSAADGLPLCGAEDVLSDKVWTSWLWFSSAWLLCSMITSSSSFLCSVCIGNVIYTGLCWQGICVGCSNSCSRVVISSVSAVSDGSLGALIREFEDTRMNITFLS